VVHVKGIISYRLVCDDHLSLSTLGRGGWVNGQVALLRHPMP